MLVDAQLMLVSFHYKTEEEKERGAPGYPMLRQCD